MIVNRIQRLSEVLHFGLGRQATTVDADKTYVHDVFGRDAGYALNGARRTALAYDPATGRIASMGVGEGRAPSRPPSPFRWTYLPGSDLKESLAYPNGDVVRWEYELRRDLVTLVSNGVHSSFRYAYDAAGRRIAKNDERYRYNPRGELILATNGVTGAEFAYRYDDIGNRLWSRELGTNFTYVANELNQYTDIVRGGVSEFPAFDLDGKQTNVVTSTGGWSVEYNGENRPVRWTRNSDGLVVTMSYDRMGRRVTKGGERFVYDNYLNIGQTVWDPTEPVATRPLMWLGEDNPALFFHDGNKNVVEFVPTGVAPSACHYTYTPFGTDTGSVGDLNPWRFSSEWYDAEICVMYYNYRHYDLKGGRWMCFDDVLAGDEMLLYTFVRNDPIRLYDELGHKCCTCPVILPPVGSHVAGPRDFGTCGMGNLGFTYHTSWAAGCDGGSDCGTCTISQTFLCSILLTQKGQSFYWMALSGEKSGCSKK